MSVAGYKPNVWNAPASPGRAVWNAFAAVRRAPRTSAAGQQRYGARDGRWMRRTIMHFLSLSLPSLQSSDRGASRSLSNVYAELGSSCEDGVQEVRKKSPRRYAARLTLRTATNSFKAFSGGFSDVSSFDSFPVIFCASDMLAG